ncbi:hypothetical protein E2C01_092623 [Portunus trituberculatus]|uniref:Uncharacterized protein n=1 Tax=Portunus trituberculatus TaxID=210409 RepID=A0A5B7JMH7_PORTR|nr:hypothetical protein [Portunus trituberculatus]
MSGCTLEWRCLAGGDSVVWLICGGFWVKQTVTRVGAVLVDDTAPRQARRHSQEPRRVLERLESRHSGTTTTYIGSCRVAVPQSVPQCQDR